MKKNFIFLHPFFFALYPVIFLYAQNIQEYSEVVIIAPLLIAFIFAAVVFFLSKLVFKNSEKAPVVASAVILLCLSYSRLLEGVTGLPSWITKIFSPDVLVVLLILILLAVVVYVLSRFSKQLEQINKLLTWLSVFLIVISSFPIISFELQTKRVFTPQKQEISVRTTKKITPPQNAPDIYYFIFDRYAGSQSLKQEYNFDNTTFLSFLQDKGFYVADKSKANYPKTFLSLGSTLNMEYLDNLTKQTNGGASPDESLATPLIRNGKVIQFLKERGYYIVNIGPKTWTPTSMNPVADKNFIIQEGTYPYADTFTTGFLNTTIAAPVLQKITQNPADVSNDAWNNEHRRIALYEIEAVEQAIAIQERPKFVLVHMLLPHDPFVFDKNCKPIAESEVNKHDHVYNYLNQLQCTNTVITNLLTQILQKSKTPPVIILQADEGPFPMKNLISKDQSWANATDTALNEKFPILNAYYFPNASTSALYDSITPVNSFRVLFNTYFGTDYELLPDKNYIFQDQKNYYKFTDVTERLD